MLRSFIIITLLLLSANSYTCAAETKSVWVLHSYNQGWPWTDRITEGIESIFDPFSKEIRLYYDHLDLHRASDSTLGAAAEYFQRKLDHIPVDVIIASDDGALQFLHKYGERLAPGTPIVFCGINTDPPTHHPRRSRLDRGCRTGRSPRNVGTDAASASQQPQNLGVG